MYVIVLSIFTRTLTGLGDLVVPASDGSEIQASVEDFRVIDEHYLLSHTLLKFLVFVVCGLFIFQYTKLQHTAQIHNGLSPCGSTDVNKCRALAKNMIFNSKQHLPLQLVFCYLASGAYNTPNIFRNTGIQALYVVMRKRSPNFFHNALLIF